MNVDKARVVALVGLLVVVTVVLVFFVWVSGGDGDAEPSEERTSESTEDGSPRGAADDGEVPPEAVDLAGAAVKAYTEYGYTDASYDSWMKRLAKMSTDNFTDLVRSRFDGPDSDAKALWKHETVATKRETKTTVEDVYVEDSGESDEGDRFVTFVVEYETSIRSMATDGWTTPTSRLAQKVTVVEVDGVWLVNNIAATAQSGSGDEA